MNVFDEYEAELLAKGRAEIKAENEWWDSLTPQQKDEYFRKKQKAEEAHDKFWEAHKEPVTDDDEEEENEDEEVC